jgi:hypothetical protein
MEVRRLRNISALAGKYLNASALPGDDRFSCSLFCNATIGNNHLLEKVACHLGCQRQRKKTRAYMP